MPSASTQTFVTDLPIQKGDLIGLDASNSGDEFAYTTVPSPGQASYWSPALGDGETLAPFNSLSEAEIGFNADVKPLPGVILIGPSTGPASGGTQVKIAGHDLTEGSAVSFGSTPALAFTVNSEEEITAISPPGSPGTVDVRVSTPGGSSPTVAGDQFTYTASPAAPPVKCVVPKLKGKTLKATKMRLKKAECKLGKVEGKNSKKAKVKKQKPKPGAVLSRGSKVNVKFG
jgi:hypothetical protein